MSLAESGIGAACFAEVTQPGTHGLHQNHTKPILPTYVAFIPAASYNTKIHGQNLRRGPEQHTRDKTTQDESKPRRPLSNTALTALYLTPDPHLNHVLCQTHTTNSLVIAHYTNRPTYNFRHQSCCSSVEENKVWQPNAEENM